MSLPEPAVAYRIDGDDRIVEVNEGWVRLQSRMVARPSCRHAVTHGICESCEAALTADRDEETLTLGPLR